MAKEVQKANIPALAEIDRLLHEPSRLAVMCLLFVVDSADFTFIVNQTGLSWGNVSVHISKLENAGYLEIEKTFKGKRPNTTLKLTPLGRQAFQKYAKGMKQVFKDF